MTVRRAPQTSTDSDESVGAAVAGEPRWGPALVLVWSEVEAARVGEVLLVPPGAQRLGFTIGRSGEGGKGEPVPLTLCRLRPSTLEPTGALQDPKISRQQLRVRPLADGALEVELCGRGQLAVNGRTCERATVRAGDLVERVGRFMLLVSRRPLAWPRMASVGAPFPFGEADEHGIVGESPALWELRRQLAFTAARGEHVLVHGPSGSGKELAVRAIHMTSSRGHQPLVARNAATIPEALIDAELFGNLRDYPNPGMPDRPGLFGEADRGALFLDEVAELPLALQTRLLRVMDRGEYQRLGEAQQRTTRMRLFGATNREPTALKHDLLARFALRVAVPGLDERPEDAPLVARHIARRLVADEPARGEPRLGAALVRAIVQQPPATHARGLTELLLRSLAADPGACLDLQPQASSSAASDEPSDPNDQDDEDAMTREQLIAALQRVGGVRELAWQKLGLRNRYQLRRLLKRHGIE